MAQSGPILCIVSGKKLRITVLETILPLVPCVRLWKLQPVDHRLSALRDDGGVVFNISGLVDPAEFRGGWGKLEELS